MFRAISLESRESFFEVFFCWLSWIQLEVQIRNRSNSFKITVKFCRTKRGRFSCLLDALSPRVTIAVIGWGLSVRLKFETALTITALDLMVATFILSFEQKKTDLNHSKAMKFCNQHRSVTTWYFLSHLNGSGLISSPFSAQLRCMKSSKFRPFSRYCLLDMRLRVLQSD